MNFEYFIAKRIIESKAYKSSVSAPIIKIGIAAIAIGIIVMMIAIATGIGLQQKIRDKAVAFNGHILVSNYDTNNSNESDKPIFVKEDFLPEIKGLNGISHIQGVATKGGVIRKVDEFEYIVVKGVGADYNWTYFEDFIVEGKLPDYTKKRNEDILISEYLANRLQLKVGEKAVTYFTKDNVNKPPSIITYKIVGIYNSGYFDFDKMYIIGDIRHIQRLKKWKKNEVGNYEVFIDDYSELKEKGAEVFNSTPSVLNTITIEEKFPFIFDWIKIFDKNIYAIIFIMILVAGINMITALLVLILERTKMIGLLKVLGSNNTSIRKLFLYNAGYLILRGLVIGNIIGIGLLLLQKYFGLIPLNPKTYYVDTVPIYINWFYIILLNIGTLVLCLLMLLVPTYIISKISPVKSLRFD